MTREIITPAGVMILGSYGDRLCLSEWKNGKGIERLLRRIERGLRAEIVAGGSAVMDRAEKMLGEYFAGKRTSFELPLLFVGTHFQKKVWEMLLTIPYGKTMSYSEMAAALGCPSAVRAVANANSANALSIFAPCHRVIGRDGSLTGYAGGLNAKELLLRLERERHTRR